MSVEGMWSFASASKDDGGIDSGGVIVLETGRVFGGDSATAYTGSYTVDRGHFRAEVRAWNWNTSFNHTGETNVWGQPYPVDIMVIFEGDLVSADQIAGTITPVAGGASLDAKLIKICELP